MTGSIACIEGHQYRIQREGRTWRAYCWCDCILGPHWHQQAEEATSQMKLREALAAKAAS